MSPPARCQPANSLRVPGIAAPARQWAMLESLRTWAVPYGGDSFLYLTVLAVASYLALLRFKERLPTARLRRFIRLAALIALPFSVLALEMEGHNLGTAVLALVWCVVIGITCKTEMDRRAP